MLLKKIVTTYLDLTNDFILLTSIMNVLDFDDSFSWENFCTFPFQVSTILMISIIVPILISAITIAFKSPLLILPADQANRFTEHQNPVVFCVARAIIILFFPLVPAMILISKENAKEKRESLKGKDFKVKDMANPVVQEKCLYLTKHINETKSALLTFKRNELSMELVIQLAITLMMLLLSKTDYPVETGLQTIFEEGNSTSPATSFVLFELLGIEESVQNFEKDNNITKWFLIFSIIWSFKTCAKTAIKIKTKTKVIMPFVLKNVMFFRYLLISTIRVNAIVAYFSPFIGLLGIMDHFHAEKIPLDPKIWEQIRNTNDGLYHYWNPSNGLFEFSHISEIFRSNYKDDIPEPPPSTIYTIISLWEAYLIFWISYIIYGLLLIPIKCFINKDFRLASKTEKLYHIIEVLNIPEAFGDWDTNLELDVKDHKKKWTNSLIEMMLMSVFQVLSNLLMLTPFLLTGNNFYFFISFIFD